MGASMRVAVAGSTGFIGRHITRGLLAAGHTVVALARDLDKAKHVLAVGEGVDRLELVQGDPTSRNTADRLLTRADACVNAIGIIREASGGQTFKKVHESVPRALVEGCKRAGVDRVVHISAIGVRDEAPTKYQQSKFEGEMTVRRSGLDWTILRLSLVHGADGEFIEMARGWVTGKALPHLFIPYFRHHESGPPVPGLAKLSDPELMPVRVEDVARAVVACLERRETVGEVINLVGAERVTMPEILRTLQAHVPLAKQSLKLVGMPDSVGERIAKAAKMVGLRDALPFDEGMAHMAGESSTASREKQQALLGFETGGCLDRVAEYAPSL